MLQRIICISIFSIICLFGYTQLPAVAAAPFEYNEDHEQYPYDLETEQSQAKYDTRLLSQQLLKEPKQSSSNDKEKTENMDYVDDDEKDEMNNNADADEEDLQPHERAASCYTHAHKYTHGQKVPRLDPCEVCLCMDGEIFCWWEKCEKRKYEKHTSTTEKTHAKHKSKSHKTLKKQSSSSLKTVNSQLEVRKRNKNDDDDKFLLHENNYVNEQSKKPLIKKKYNQEQSKKKEFNQKQQKIAQQKQQQQQQNQKQQQQLQHKHSSYHHSPAMSSSSSSSKILSFPENLPSVLYYDYHTEEHEHHQHQHHQQHLKHQLQKKLQCEQRQHTKKHAAVNSAAVTSQLTTSPLATYSGSSDGGGSGSGKTGINENATSSAYDEALTDSDILPEPPTKKPPPKMTSNGQTIAAISAASALAASTTSTAFTTMDGLTSWHSITDVERRRQKSHLYNNAKVDDDSDISAMLSWEWPQQHQTVLAKVDEKQQNFISETLATASIIARDNIVEINKNLKQKSQKKLNVKVDNGKANDKGSDNVEKILDVADDLVDDDDEDEAFHRWLTSTESNKSNKNNNTNNNNDNNDNNNNIGNKTANTNADNINAAANGYGNGNNGGYQNEEFQAYATEISDFENPFGIQQNLTINSQQLKKNTNKNYNSNRNNNKNKNRNGSNKVFYPKDQQQSVQNAENGFLHENDNNNGDNDGDGNGVGNGDGVSGVGVSDVDYNTASVVNIDILLTTPDEPQQQQQQKHYKQTTTKTEQLPRAPTSIKFAADLISHVENNNMGEAVEEHKGVEFEDGSRSSTKPSAKALNDIKMKTKATSMAMGGLPPKGPFDKEREENFAVTQTAASSTTLLTPTTVAEVVPPSVQFIKQPSLPSVALNDGISRTAFDLGRTNTVGTTTTTTTLSTTRQCNVMGTLYKIGDVLPQDTGNCLQCICIEGSTSDDTPRVTCSPHNCPPLVLPDLFDATGY